MTSIPGIVQSTYRSSYKGELPSQPQIKYKTLPCLYPKGSTEPCRLQCSTEYKHVALKRVKNQVSDHQQMLLDSSKKQPNGSIQSTDHQNKVFQTKFGPMDMATIDLLHNKRRYTTFAQKDGAEFPLPMHKPTPPSTTQEPKADMIRLLGRKYEDNPEQWQDAVLWDRIQPRALTLTPMESQLHENVLRRRQTTNALDEDRQETITELVRNDGLANVFVRKCPGYAGYNPLCPPETKLGDQEKCHGNTSLMASSYRKFPNHVYKPRSHARKGIFSKTVTLTYPLNPFNKVGQEITAVDKESRYAGMNDFMDLVPV